MKRIGFYSGSFDPITNGHTDVLRRSAALVDRLVIGIGIHPGKTPHFSTEEKTSLIDAEMKPIS
ncbi:MAG: adenylyltransferase/cytidyltransferase family protein, partial [Hyphomicrobiaceae bacterium]